eukprot:752335-Hanusia_phi.AAC.5
MEEGRGRELQVLMCLCLEQVTWQNEIRNVKEESPLRRCACEQHPTVSILKALLGVKRYALWQAASQCHPHPVVHLLCMPAWRVFPRHATADVVLADPASLSCRSLQLRASRLLGFWRLNDLFLPSVARVAKTRTVGEVEDDMKFIPEGT